LLNTQQDTSILPGREPHYLSTHGCFWWGRAEPGPCFLLKWKDGEQPVELSLASDSHRPRTVTAMTQQAESSPPGEVREGGSSSGPAFSLAPMGSTLSKGEMSGFLAATWPLVGTVHGCGYSGRLLGFPQQPRKSPSILMRR
jgi:hypothetical protein